MIESQTLLTPGVWQVQGTRLVNLDSGAVADLTPPATEQPPVTFGLSYSTSPSRVTPLPLADAVIAQPVAVFVTPEAGVTRVDFHVDGVFERTEATAPFDLKGGDGASAYLWAPTGGPHSIRAIITKADLSVEDFTVAITSTINATPDPTPPPDPEPDPSGIPQIGGFSRPGTASTGPRYAMTPSGGITTSRNGQVIERLDIIGTVTVRHRDVIIRDCRIRSTAEAYGVNISSTAVDGQRMSGLVIEYTEVDMQNRQGSNSCIGGNNSTAPLTKHGDSIIVRFCNLHGWADGIKSTAWGLYEHNYIHVQRAPDNTTKHVDGIQGSGSSNYTVRYNWVDHAYSAGFNAAVFFQAYTGTVNRQISGIRVYHNWLNGGVYTVSAGGYKTNPASGGIPTELSIVDTEVYDNLFYRQYKYGVLTFSPYGGGQITAGPGVRGGRWADTLQPVTHGNLSAGG